MANGYALCIGLNRVDPVHYQGWDGKLNAAEKDAADIQALAKTAGFRTDLITGANATRNNVLAALNNAAANLQSGDIFVLYYSGHGGQLPDLDGDEDDGKDETWCLYDSQLLDDEIKLQWPKFKEDVRIFMLSDSCHSGTISKFDPNQPIQARYTNDTPKAMPYEIETSIFLQNSSYYRRYISEVDVAKSVFDESQIKASVRLISGCQDNQQSYDGILNSKFTEKLLVIWNGGKFSGNYSRFHLQIQALLPAYQSPNHLLIGKRIADYDAQVPFTINAQKGGCNFIIDLNSVELTEDQMLSIDSILQKTVTSELAKLGNKDKIQLIPISGKGSGFGGDRTFGYMAE